MITQNDIHNYITTAREEGEINGCIKVARNLLKSGDDDSKILSVTGISKEQLEQIKAE